MTMPGAGLSPVLMPSEAEMAVLMFRCGMDSRAIASELRATEAAVYNALVRRPARNQREAA